MKPFLMLLFVLFIVAGCQMDEAGNGEGQLTEVTEKSTVEPTDENEEKTDEQGKTVEESTQFVLNQSLSNALVQLIRDYAIYSDASIIFNDEYLTGVLYTELIDFDRDGQMELYVLSKTADWQVDEGYKEFYTHEVWRAAPDQAERVLFEQFDAAYSYCESCGEEVTLYKHSNGTWSLSFAMSEYFDDGAVFTQNIYELVGNEMKPTIYVFETWDAIGESYAIDGEAVSEEKYRERFGGEYKQIITNTVGQMDFAFDGADYNRGITNSSATVISNVLSQLNSDFNTLEKTGKRVNADELMEYMETFDDMQLVDIQDSSVYTDMLHNLLDTRIYIMVDSDVPNNEISEELSYWPISEELVFAQFEKLYGVPFKDAEIGLATPSYENITETTYEDGIFYVRISELALPDIVHDINAAYEISPNTYYVESTMREFNWLYHAPYEQELEEDPYRMFNEESPDTWPFELRHFTKTGIKRYTVFHVDGDSIVLRYYHYVPLSDVELEGYK